METENTPSQLKTKQKQPQEKEKREENKKISEKQNFYGKRHAINNEKQKERGRGT